MFDLSDLQSQSISEQEWVGLSEGLSSNKVIKIIQDSTGFLWVMTPEGIDRYDGIRFKNYNQSKNSPVVLLDKNPFVFQVKKPNVFWLFGKRSIQILDVQKDSILHQKQYPKGTSVSMPRFMNGKFWFSLVSNDSTYLIRQKDQLELDTIFSKPFNLGPEGFIVNSKNELFYFNKKAQFIKYDISNKHSTVLDSTTYIEANWPNKLRMFFDSKQRIWVFNRWWTKKEPNLSFWENGRFHLPNIPKVWLRKQGQKNKDEVYLMDMKSYSLYLLNCTTEELNFVHDFEKHTKVLMNDDRGVLWIGNETDGFKRTLFSDQLPFQNHLTPAQNKNARIIAIRDFTELPNRDVLFSTNNGLYKYLKTKDSIVDLDYINLKGRLEKPERAYRLYYDKIQNRIWTSQTKGVQNYIDYSDSVLKEQKRIIPKDQIVLHWKEDEIIWLLGQDKLHPVELKKDSFNYIKNEWPLPPKKLDVFHFLKSRNGHFWLATNKGLYHYDVDGSYIDRIDSEHHLFPLNSSTVYDVWESKNGLIWLATHAGLHQLNLETAEMIIYTRKDGLCNDIVCSLLEDNQANFWLGTFNGLSRFDPLQEVFYNYFEEDGLPSNEFNISARLKASDGQLFFGGVQGFTTFYPSKIARSGNLSPLVLTKYSTFTKDGKKLKEQEKNLNELTKINLPYNNKFFRFEFALLNYINPKRNTYSWYLEGFEKDWGKPSKYAEAQYNNIPAGDYTFRLRAADYSGSWSENQIAVKVHIQQVFYKTIWFAVLSACILFFILYSWYRYRLRQLLAIENMRNKIARDLHDDIGSALTRLSIQSQIIETKLKDPTPIHNFSNILIQSISKLRDVVWSIDSGHDKFEDLLDRMKDYVYDTLHPKDVSYHFDIQKLDSNKKLTPAFRQNVYLIFKESINNIIRHTEATTVHIIIKNKMDGKYFEMQIKDNGNKGVIEKSSGLGLKSMRRRANELDGNLEVTAGDKGFTVRLLCPMI